MNTLVSIMLYLTAAGIPVAFWVALNNMAIARWFSIGSVALLTGSLAIMVAT
jgi:hypothetical protein